MRSAIAYLPILRYFCSRMRTLMCALHGRPDGGMVDTRGLKIP